MAAAKAADVNPFAGSLTMVVEPRLSSAGRWYVTADPAEIDGLEFAYLRAARGRR
uniref:Flavoprotein involved in K+ transport n=1 Tax=Magnetospirillum gryphiswaldense TaxID=55518 RepID=A4TTU3_9PROT|nr:flavoprotein involved in K+ transport [Magnetospirillum gryphiswaldense MSR-1]